MKAISIAIRAAVISAVKAESVTMFWAKQPMVNPWEFLKIPPHAAFNGFLTTAPSVLTLNQLNLGGCHKTSMTKGALGGWMLTLKAFKITNYVMSTTDDLLVRLPDRDTLEIIKLIADFQ